MTTTLVFLFSGGDSHTISTEIRELMHVDAGLMLVTNTIEYYLLERASPNTQPLHSIFSFI